MVTPNDIDLPERVSTPPEGWRSESVGRVLDGLCAAQPNLIERTLAGRSAEGRPIESVLVGRGETRVLAWSQMHGDEQTYTTVVLNLLRLLARAPSAGIAARLLDACRLQLIPLLNPDGAERGVRFNAQGIDLNRDGRDPATPEARLLRRAVLEWRPRFAFNLHNQCARRRLPSGEGPIALSVLAPAADASGELSPSMAAAERVAARVVEATRPHCGGRVTRYSAHFMPRAFGEWVQSQGVATVLLEAGGWPGGDLRELEQLNLLAFLAGLMAIADGSHPSADASLYRDLPFASDHEAFDLLINRAEFAHDDEGPPVVVDLGVNATNPMAAPPRPGGGVLADIGDLSPHAGHRVINAAGQVALPGRIMIAAGAVGPGHPLDKEVIESAAKAGATTLLLPLDLDAPGALDWARETSWETVPLVNLGFVGVASTVDTMLRVTAERDIAAPLVGWTTDANELIGGARSALTAPLWRRQTRRLADRWSLSGQHTIARGGAANLVLVDKPAAPDEPIVGVRSVIVGGSVVVADGEIVERDAGAWLRRRTVVEPGR